MLELDVNRNSALIDPVLSIWGWEIAAYLYLGGLVAGLMIFGALAMGTVAKGTTGAEPAPVSRWLRYAPFAAPVLISLGMLLLFLDLEHKLYVWRFYLAFRPASPMSWGAWILVLLYPATLLWGLANLTRAEVDWLASWSPVGRAPLARALAWLGDVGRARLVALRSTNIVLGLVLGLYTGVLLGTFVARPLWNSTLLAPLFLASGLSSGAAFMMLFPLSDSEHHRLARWDLFAIGAEVVFLVLFFVDRATGGAAGRGEVSRFFGGDLTAPFWALVVFVGLAAPVEARRSLRPTVVAPILILVGGLALRFILVHAGQVGSVG
jgi:formate-dependent nitrite reductase membrane component NrfD